MNQSDKIALLNTGSLQTRNLMDALSIDLNILLSNTFPQLQVSPIPKELGITKKMKFVAEFIYKTSGMLEFENLKNHPSDTIRGFACYLIAEQPTDLIQKLHDMYPLAKDHHFGVREWAWLALRPEIAANILQSLQLLKNWFSDSNENIRRFACEITRPRGVWCSHIKDLRREPWIALDSVEQLNNDPSKYVQLSLGNWLNDAGKDHPEWVSAVCLEWLSRSNTINTQKICKRAQRNITGA